MKIYTEREAEKFLKNKVRVINIKMQVHPEVSKLIKGKSI